ncbi:hypothetical protein LCGC14_2560630 [marine sediment metagenome]|uniref:Uncharacterized protein n=1 Tax=marine sediment metagenome TaxID=412755 RepID=A0A0F9B810_9ZZZZ
MSFIRVDTTVYFDLADIIESDLEWFLDEISERATGTIAMQDIAWDVKGATDTGDLVLHVVGQIDSDDLASEEYDDVLEHIKSDKEKL